MWKMFPRHCTLVPKIFHNWWVILSTRTLTKQKNLPVLLFYKIKILKITFYCSSLSALPSYFYHFCLKHGPVLNRSVKKWANSLEKLAQPALNRMLYYLPPPFFPPFHVILIALFASLPPWEISHPACLCRREGSHWKIVKGVFWFCCRRLLHEVYLIQQW